MRIETSLIKPIVVAIPGLARSDRKSTIRRVGKKRTTEAPTMDAGHKPAKKTATRQPRAKK